MLVTSSIFSFSHNVFWGSVTRGQDCVVKLLMDMRYCGTRRKSWSGNQYFLPGSNVLSGNQYFLPGSNVLFPIRDKFTILALINSYAPASIDQGHIVLIPSVCPSIRLSIHKNFYFGHNVWMVSEKAFIYFTYIFLGVQPLFSTKAKSSVKVKYQGQIFQTSGA